ncbi:ATP-binding cassette sub-family G member 4-like [Aricia agestis]|uniref:ATP-binding cassette sub-family G member 4-like n=1 Tax=Aricia agestis TaxID=91739 RepID=UPI001C203686|nr:ATP-binding cassette sub-family G member 4-like [Aricia agestis]
MAASISIPDTQSDSQETNSTSLVEDTFNISFENICYKVRGFIKEPKVILDGVNGQFSAGELSVLMGQSGAGKSSLLDILAGYTKPTSGRILLNGRVRNEKMFRRRSCYILQEDRIQDTLTVEESLNIAAELKLGNQVSREQKQERIKEIITSLGIVSNRHTRACNLSGGQKKRLAIGLELVTDPAIMFLDEPTSGLDSSTAKQIMYLLHLLARQGRTVVISIHQPSAALLSLVDRLYGIAAGKCAYIGSVRLLRPFLEQFDLVCPLTHDPVDFFIEKSGEKTQNDLVKKLENGKSIQWIENTIEIDSDIVDNIFKNSNSDRICLTSLPPPKEDPTSKILMALKSTYPTTSWKQFSVLTRRACLLLWRNPSNILMITSIHVLMALFVGTLFYDIGWNASYVRDNYNLLYFCLMFIMFTAFSSVSVNFPEQIPIIRREHFNRWYNAGSYYFSTLVSCLPLQTVCTLLFSGITYYMAGQPLEAKRFFIYSLTLLLVSYVALIIGLFNGSILNVKNGVIFGPFFIMPFTIFSGFFLRLCDAPSYIRWLFHLSFLKYGLSGMVISIYGMDREKLPCTDLFCYYTYPRQFLKDNEVEGVEYWTVVLALFIIAFVFILCAYIALKIRLKCKW